MKLRNINENFISQKMRDAIVTSKALCDRPLPATTDTPYEPSSGHDAISQAAGAISMVSGIPKKPRHQRFFGMETRPGTIRL